MRRDANKSAATEENDRRSARPNADFNDPRHDTATLTQPLLLIFALSMGDRPGSLPSGRPPCFFTFCSYLLIFTASLFPFPCQSQSWPTRLFPFSHRCLKVFFSILHSLARRFRRSYHQKKDSCLLRFVYGSEWVVVSALLSSLLIFGRLVALCSASEKKKKNEFHY